MKAVRPLISVITPTYNRAHVIERAIKSVLNQTESNFEYIIVDDGSKDDTDSVMQKYLKNDSRIIYHKHEVNQGQNPALNTGLTFARGKYVAFLDSDDEWLPEMLEKQLLQFSSDSDVSCSYTKVGYIEDDVVKTARDYSITGYLYKEALEQMYICNPSSLMIKKESLESIGGFRNEYTVCQDDDVCLRLAKKYKFALVKEVLAIIHNDSGNQTIKNKTVYAEDKFRLYNEYENEVLKFCGPKVLSKHYLSSASLFLKALNPSKARKAIKKANHYNSSKRGNLLLFATFIPTFALDNFIRLRRRLLHQNS